MSDEDALKQFSDDELREFWEGLKNRVDVMLQGQVKPGSYDRVRGCLDLMRQIEAKLIEPESA